MKYIHMLAFVLAMGTCGPLCAEDVQSADAVPVVDIEREFFIACLKSCHAGKCVENPDRCPCNRPTAKPFPRPRAGELDSEDSSTDDVVREVSDKDKENNAFKDGQGEEDDSSSVVDESVQRNRSVRADRCPCNRPQAQPRPNNRPNGRPNARPQGRPNARQNVRPVHRSHAK